MDEQKPIDAYEEYVEETKVSAGLYFAIAGIEILVLFLTVLLVPDFYTQGRTFLYLLIWGNMLLIWSKLNDGKLSKRGQVIMFAVVPYFVYLLIQLVSLSNWCGVIFLIIYSVVLSLLFDIDLNDGGSSSGNSTTGKIAGKMVGSVLHDLTKTSKRKRK